MKILGNGPIWAAVRAMVSLSSQRYGIKATSERMEISPRTLTAWFRRMGAESRCAPPLNRQDLDSVFSFFDECGVLYDSASCSLVNEQVVQIESESVLQDVVNLLLRGNFKLAQTLLLNHLSLSIDLEGAFDMALDSEAPEMSPGECLGSLDQETRCERKRLRMIALMIRSGSSVPEVKAEFDVEDEEILAALGG